MLASRSSQRLPAPPISFRLAFLTALVLLFAACGASEQSDTAAGLAQVSDEADDEAAEAMEDVASDGDASEEPVADVATNAVATSLAPSRELEDSQAQAAEDGGEDAAATDEEGVSEEVESEPGESNDLGAGAVASTQQTAADLGRKIIFNAFITVEVDDVGVAGQEASDIIAGLGGFIYGQETETGSSPRSTLVFKVLPEDFDAAIEALGTVGELRAQSITANDVTERIVDLATRIEVAELGVDRLRATLTNTTDLADYAELERLLLERETELEVMRAQIRNLQDQVNLATITLTVTQDQINHGIQVAATIYEAHDGGQSCPGDGVDSVPQGTDVTICYEVVNTGEEPVVGITIIDPALGIDGADDLKLVFGALDRLEAGQSTILAFETKVERDLNLRSKVTARPANVDGEVSGPSIDARVGTRLNTYLEPTEPGFFDGFDAGVNVIKTVWSVGKVLIGFLLPMLILLPFLVLAWLGVGRLRRAQSNRGPKIRRKDRRPTVITRPPADDDVAPPPPSGQRLGDPDPTNVFGDDG